MEEPKIDRNILIKGLARTSPDDQLGQLREKAEFVAKITGQNPDDPEVIQENLDQLVDKARQKSEEPENLEYPPQD